MCVGEQKSSFNLETCFYWDKFFCYISDYSVLIPLKISILILRLIC